MQSNHMNNMLTSLYRTNSNSNTAREVTTQNDFPIDISSDDSDDDNNEDQAVNNGRYND